MTGGAAVPERSLEEDRVLVEALERAGLTARVVSWTEAGFAWSEVRLVLVRSAFDWPDSWPAFAAWARSVAAVTRLRPSLEIITRYASKSYLRRFFDQGVPVVPTLVVKAGHAGSLAARIAPHGWSYVVVKPAVGLAAHGVRRFGPPTIEDGQRHLERLVTTGPALIQPHIGAIQKHGETSVTFAGGELLHAVRRLPAKGDFRAHQLYAGLDEVTGITEPVARLSHQVLEVIGPGALCGRIDWIQGSKGLVLSEVELLSPTLYLDQAPASVDRLTGAIVRDLGHERIVPGRPSLAGPPGVLVRRLHSGASLPIEVTPEEWPGTKESLEAWLRGNLDWVEQKLLDHGAILLRGFGLESAEDFRHITEVLDDSLLDYQGGISARDRVIERVYESTHYQRDLAIELHNELSHTRSWPSKILFFCRVPPVFGGQTPIADGRALLAALPDATRTRFAERGIRYQWIYPDGGKPVAGDATPWQKAFQTEERAVVEAACGAAGVTCEWLEDGAVRTTSIREALHTHPKTQQVVWFNQADVRAAIRERGMLRTTTTFADGSPIPEEDIVAIRAASEQVASIFPWQRGDLLVLDNVLALHGRRPYRGPRDILVTMCRGRS